MGLISHGQLEAIGIDQLSTANTEAEYIEKNVALVVDFLRLADLTAMLRECMKKAWLMDSKDCGREALGIYRKMWRECCLKQSGNWKCPLLSL